MKIHPGIQTVTAALAAAGVKGEVRVLPDSARTATEAAAALGVEVGAIASSLIFDAAGEPMLILTSGAHRVNTLRVATDQELPALSRANADFVRAATGQAIGGVAPLGHPQPLRTFVDNALAAHDEVWAAGGHPHAVFPTSFAELLTMTGGTAIDVD